MTSPFDADDMMKRGLFSSLMGFKKKMTTKTTTSSVASVMLQNTPVVTSSPATVNAVPCQVQHLTESVNERTQHDIFREIVCECEHFERSTTNSPFPDSSSMTPIQHPLPPLNMPLGPQMYPHYDTYQRLPFSPPPYSPVEQTFSPPPVAPQTPLFAANPQQLLLSSLGSGDIQNNALLEEVVKMVVNAMKQSSLADGIPQKESPEEILRRKRQQNNEAAARYRKRQRDAREKTDEELGELSKRNDELRMKIKVMEDQISQLKSAVLKTN